ncbi:MAG: ATP-dependent Clp protease ATP-binding subunit [Planctomycetaceae bacterium]|nr:ATP-dependent Clp protease ATP-binding subunit [Planctomycetaceae bacterium]
MPSIDIRIHVIGCRYEVGNPFQLGQALFFPEVSCLAEQEDHVRNNTADCAMLVLADVPNLEVSRRLLADAPQKITAEVLVEPTVRSRQWERPVLLRLPGVQWQQSGCACVAWFPEIGVEVLAERVDLLPERIENQIRMYLLRHKAATTLRELMMRFRSTDLSVNSVTMKHLVLPPKQQEQDAHSPVEESEPELPKVSAVISGLTHIQAFHRESQAEQLAEILTGRLPRSILLIGPSGVGKTAIVRETVRQSTELGLRDWTFRSTSGSRLVSGMTGFGMWQERCEKLRREMSDGHVILVVGSLLELTQVGQSENQSQSIASYLRPFIARREILLIAEATPEEVAILERQEPGLLRAFEHVQIQEPDLKDRIRILTSEARRNWRSTAELFSSDAIEEIERLHRRFATYSAFPARPLRFLRNLRRDVASQRESSSLDAASSALNSVIGTTEVIRAFSRETGLPDWMLNEFVPLGLAEAEAWFETRIAGQHHAVELIVNLLATLKAGLNRDHRPLASLMFIGPTGVGKTEMARTLASFLFGSSGVQTANSPTAPAHSSRDDSRLIRIDMSEYADATAVQRLIGGTRESEGILTGRVREQPFSVVLLDEFEKAHPDLFDLLLQILGEGRLTDAAGRVADFRNSVMIMTSNLGGLTHQKGTPGFSAASDGSDRDREGSDRDTARMFEKAVRDFVRPEFFNRIDRIVPFAPLSRRTARKIVERQLQTIGQRDGLRFRRVTLSYEEPVIEYLLDHGFEEKYGARSLKRIMERDLIAPLAQQLNTCSADAALTAVCSVSEDDPVHPQLVVRVKAVSVDRQRFAVCIQEVESELRPDEDSRDSSVIKSAATAGPSVHVTTTQLEVVNRLRELRAGVRRVLNGPAVRKLQNQIFQGERSRRRWQRALHHEEADLRRQHEIQTTQQWMDSFRDLCRQLESHEEQALMAIYGDDAVPLRNAAQLQETLTHCQVQLQEYLLDLLDMQQPEPNTMRMLLVSDRHAVLESLTRAYCRAAQAPQRNGASASPRLTCWRYLSPGTKRESIADEDWSSEKLHWVPADPDVHQTALDRLASRLRSIESRGGVSSDNDELWLLVPKAVDADASSTSLPVDESTPRLVRQLVTEADLAASATYTGVLGLWLEIQAPRVWNRFCGEDGLHRFVSAETTSECSVFCGVSAIDDYIPPNGIDRPGVIRAGEKCREYDAVKDRVVDRVEGEIPRFAAFGALDRCITELINKRMRRMADSFLVE